MNAGKTPSSISSVAAGRAEGRFRRWLAVGTAACTLFLIFIGGTVTSNDAGLAVPDWPTTFGHNMFLYPPSGWVGDVFFEHSHRLAGAAVGMLMIALAVATQLREPRRWVRVLAWCMLAVVIVQGLLGGFRVTEKSIVLAIVHGCLAQLLLCAAVCMAMFTSARWSDESGMASAVAGRSGIRLCVVTSVAVFGQLILGAVYRHLGVGLVYHVLGAIVVTTLISTVVMWVSCEHPDQQQLMAWVKVLGGLLVAQLVLGVGAYIAASRTDPARTATLLEWLIPSLHVVVGASVLAASVALSATALSVFPSEKAVVRSSGRPEVTIA